MSRYLLTRYYAVQQQPKVARVLPILCPKVSVG